MFSGIIQAVVPVQAICDTINYRIYTVTFPESMLTDLKVGCSVANNGCCLTVISVQYNLVSFNLMHDTLKLTNMKILKMGDYINIERSLKYHSEIGGHLMTGHIDCTGKIKKIINLKNSTVMWLIIKNKNFQKYIIQKGSIGIEGVSLTVNKIVKNYIRICLTSYTITKTTLGTKKVGNTLNVETDYIMKAIVKTAEKYFLPFIYQKKIN